MASYHSFVCVLFSITTLVTLIVMKQLQNTSESETRFPGSCRLTNSFADSSSGIHLVAIVTLALVSSFQVNANLTADSRIQTLIDVCTQRQSWERCGEGKPNAVGSSKVNG